MRAPLRHLATTLCFAVCAFAMPAVARPFHMIRAGDDVFLLIDPASIEPQPDSTVRRAWVVSVQRSIVSGDFPQAGYVRTLTDYNCARRETHWRSFSAFARNGDLLVEKENPSTAWIPAISAPDILAAYRVVCEGGRGQSVLSADSLAKAVISLMSTWDATPVGPPKVGASPLAGPAVVPAKPVAKPVTPAVKPAPKR